jgi:hypothetical protein
MPAADVETARLGAPGGFTGAVRKTDLVYFVLNVGDGDTQLLLLPEDARGHRRCVVVDCIRAEKLFALLDALAETPLLPEITPLLCLVVATHPHDDHISGMAQLLRRFGDEHVAEVWEPGYYHTSGSYMKMMREIEDHDIAHLQPAAGTTRFIGGVKVTVLAPSVSLRNRFDSYGIDINNASIALKLDFPAARTYERDGERVYLRLPTTQTLILGADAQTDSWAAVGSDFPQLGPESTAVTKALQRARGTEPLSAQVFKIPHHGSKHGMNLELVETIKPAVSIVSSVHDGGRYHFPHAVTQAALREALAPISSKPGTDHPADADISILYTGSRELDAAGADLGPVGTVAMLVGAGGRREVWRFGDAASDKLALASGRPMRTSPLPAPPAATPDAEHQAAGPG